MKMIENYTPYHFQDISIKRGIEMIESVGSLLLATDTGLGKTVVAATIANTTILPNEKLLVIAPKATHKSWANILRHTGINYEIIGNRSIPAHTTKCDFIIIDEIHKIGNAESATYIALAKLIIYNQSRVIGISATPYNNKMEHYTDLLLLLNVKNQVVKMLLDRVISEINEFTYDMEIKTRYNNNLSMREMVVVGEITSKRKKAIEILSSITALFTIRDRRNSIPILESEHLLERFPVVTKKTLPYGTGDNGSALTQIVRDLAKANYAYQNQLNYYNSDGSGTFGAVYKTTLYKLLESSFGAFRLSVENNLNNIKNIIQAGQITIGDTTNDLTELFFSDLNHDLVIFQRICDNAKMLDDSEKLNTVFEVVNATEGKVVIFTEYNETFNILCNDARARGIKFISYNSATDDKVLDIIAQNFDANQDKISNEYKLLICTDTLAEGVNLHHADTLVHFDNKWNPSKILQREGRIDRININSKVNDITVYTMEIPQYIDSQITLTDKIENKIFEAELIFTNIDKPIDLNAYIHKLDSFSLDTRNTTGGFNRKDVNRVFFVDDTHYIAFRATASGYDLPLTESIEDMEICKLYMVHEDDIPTPKTVFTSYSEYAKEMQDYKTDRRLGSDDWVNGNYHYSNTIMIYNKKSSNSSVRAIKNSREYVAYLNTYKKNTNNLEIDREMVRTYNTVLNATNSYSYILHKIFVSMEKEYIKRDKDFNEFYESVNRLINDYYVILQRFGKNMPMIEVYQ